MISLHVIPVGVYRDIVFSPLSLELGSMLQLCMAEYLKGPFLKSYFHIMIKGETALLVPYYLGLRMIKTPIRSA